MSKLPLVLALVITVPPLIWASRASKKRATGTAAIIGATINMLLPFVMVWAIFRLGRQHLPLSLPWVGFGLLIALSAWYFASMMWIFGVRAPQERR